MYETNNIKARIEQVCEMLNLSKANFCKRLGITYEKLVHIYNGRSKFNWPEIKIMNELGINPYWLIDGEGEPFADNLAGRRLAEKCKGDTKEPERIPLAVFERSPEYDIEAIAERAAEKAYEKGRRQGREEFLEEFEKILQQARENTGDATPLYVAAGRLKKKK